MDDIEKPFPFLDILIYRILYNQMMVLFPLSFRISYPIYYAARTMRTTFRIESNRKYKIKKTLRTIVHSSICFIPRSPIGFSFVPILFFVSSQCDALTLTIAPCGMPLPLPYILFFLLFVVDVKVCPCLRVCLSFFSISFSPFVHFKYVAFHFSRYFYSI